MKRFWGLMVGFFLLVASSWAQAAPTVTYTTSGTPGNYVLDFTVTNTLGVDNMDIYLFGVLVDNGVAVLPAPTGFLPYNMGWNTNVYGGPDLVFTCEWFFGGPDQNKINKGETIGGFIVNVTAVTAPTSVQWFAFAHASIPGGPEVMYWGGDNFHVPYNPGFIGVATGAPPPLAYVANYLSGSVSVIDTSTNTVVATVGVGGNPNDLAITPDGTRAYVTRTPDYNSVSVIDTSSNTVVAVVGVGSMATGVSITPDGTRAYVSNANSNSVSVIDTSSNTVVATVGVGNSPFGVAFAPDGSRAYVTNAYSNSVSVIDTSTNTVTATVEVGIQPVGIRITPDGTRAYVTNQSPLQTQSSTVSVIDTMSNTVVATVNVGPHPHEPAITPDGTRVYVSHSFYHSNVVSVIDTSSNTVVATIPLGDDNHGLAITPDGTHAYVTIISTKSVSVIDISSNTVVATAIPVGSHPVEIAFSPGPSVKPVANAGSGQTIHVGRTVNLDGSGSSDASGLTLTYMWSFDSIPAGSSAIISNPTSVNPTFTTDAPGDFVVRLIVTNSSGSVSSPSTVTFSTTNSPPVADAGLNRAITLIGSTVYLNGNTPGRESYDPDGDPLNYNWSFSSKPSGSTASLIGASTATPTFIADVHGTYMAQLVVSDPWANSGPATVTISFVNVAPDVDPGANQSVPVDVVAFLDGSGSRDDNGDPLTYRWSFISKPAMSSTVISSPTDKITSLVPDLPGAYIVQLIVNDGFVDGDPRTVTIQAYATESAAIATATDTQVSVSSIPVLALKNANMKNTLLNKLNNVIANIDAGLYASALDQLKNDLLGKTDGCARTGAPDKNDWITTCQEQNQVYPLILETIWIVEGLLPL